MPTKELWVLPLYWHELLTLRHYAGQVAALRKEMETVNQELRSKILAMEALLQAKTPRDSAPSRTVDSHYEQFSPGTNYSASTSNNLQTDQEVCAQSLRY